MKPLLRSALAAATFSLALIGAARAVEAKALAADTEPGYVDIGRLVPSTKGEFVEVNLSPALLKFAARISSRHEPEAAELIGNLKHVRINVVSLDDGNRAGTIEQIETVRRKLGEQGWTKMVTVRGKDAAGDDVDIHVKQRGEAAIDGIVITVIDRKGDAVFVNIVGNITADQLTKIADRLEIEPLRRLHVRFDRQHKDKDGV